MSLKLRAAEFLCRPVVGRWVSRVCRGRIPSLRFRGWRVATDAPGVRPGTVASIFWGIYESAEIRFVRRYLRPDLDVVELGASLGVVSAEVSMRQERGRRICVEANPALVPLLRRNVATNSRRGGEIVLNRAVDYGGRGTIRFVRGETSAGGRTAAVSRLLAGAEKWDEVEAVTLSQLLDEFDVGPYALVSDIEGSEAGFISYDAAALARCRQLIIELHDVSGEELQTSVESMRRALVDIHGFRERARHGPVFVFERDDSGAGPATRSA